MKCNLIVKIYSQSYVQNFTWVCLFSRIDLTEAGEQFFCLLGLLWLSNCGSFARKSILPTMFRSGLSRFARWRATLYNTVNIPIRDVILFQLGFLNVQSLFFHAYSSSNTSGESTLVGPYCRRANRSSGETSWYHRVLNSVPLLLGRSRLTLVTPWNLG